MKRLLALALLVLAAAQAQAANVNVAFGAPVFGNGPIYGGDPLRKLTDGDLLPQIHADTTPPTGFAYWLDLGSSHALNSIKLWPRQDFPCCPERLSNIRVSVHNDDGGGNIGAEVWGANLFPPPSNAGSGPGVVVTVTDGMGAGTFTGRWVKLTALTDPVPDYSLQVTEIQVFANGPANLALGAATAANQPIYADWPTAWLVNGSLADQIHHATTSPAPGFAYTINLGAVASLDHINVFARQDGCCADRLSNYRVSVHQDSGGAIGAEVWGADLHTDGSNPGSGPSAKDVITSGLDLGGTFQGQWIQIRSLDDPTVHEYALQISEVAVHGSLVQPILNVVSQPQSGVGYLGQPAVFTFNVTVVDGDQGLVTYQWKTNGVDVPGATSASYTNASVTTFDETNLWKCVVSYPTLPSLTSDEVGLDIDYAFGAAAFANGPLWAPGGWNISRIVDGYRGAGFAGVHGDTADLLPLGFAYWFDMHTTINITSIVVWARQDGCCRERLRNYRLTVHDDDNGAIGPVVWMATLHNDGSDTGSGAGARDVILGDLDPFVDFVGRWIKIESLEDPVPNYALQVTEIEVFGSAPPGIAIYITQQPADASSSPFRTATFSASAAVLNGSFANLSYQWQRNGVNIPGAVSNSFTTPLLCADDEGAKYRCVVSYPSVSSIMTREATLTFDYNYARGSSAYSNRPLYAGWPISWLVDGNRLGVFHGDTGIAPGFAYTINMGFPVDIDRIDIYPRQDPCCPERFTKVRVSVHNDDGLGAIGDAVWVADFYADGSNPGSGPGIVVTATAGMDVGGLFSGQWIKLESLEDPVQNYALQVTELEVIGKARALCWKIAPGGSLVLSWDHGTLESALNVTGVWGEVMGATSPLTISYTGEKRFFRLRIP